MSPSTATRAERLVPAVQTTPKTAARSAAKKIAAMKASWKMVNKHWWQVFGLTLLISLVNIAGMFACLVGLLFTLPIGFGALMYAYETIFGDQKN